MAKIIDEDQLYFTCEKCGTSSEHEGIVQVRLVGVPAGKFITSRTVINQDPGHHSRSGPDLCVGCYEKLFGLIKSKFPRRRG